MACPEVTLSAPLASRSVRELLRLDGRVLVVTGGAGRIAAVLADALAEVRARPVIVDPPGANGAGVAEAIRSRYALEALSLAVDLEHDEDVRTIPSRVEAVCGAAGRAAAQAASGTYAAAGPQPAAASGRGVTNGEGVTLRRPGKVQNVLRRNRPLELSQTDD